MEKRTRPDVAERNQSAKGYGHPSNRPCHTPMGIFHSLSLAARAHGMSRQAIYNRINSASPRNVNWYYVEKRNG